jgi:hypothetical protein
MRKPPPELTVLRFVDIESGYVLRDGRAAVEA